MRFKDPYLFSDFTEKRCPCAKGHRLCSGELSFRGAGDPSGGIAGQARNPLCESPDNFDRILPPPRPRGRQNDRGGLSYKPVISRRRTSKDAPKGIPFGKSLPIMSSCHKGGGFRHKELLTFIDECQKIPITPVVSRLADPPSDVSGFAYRRTE